MGEIIIRWIDGKMMAATDSNGHSVVIGRNPEGSGFVGVKPSDLLLMAAASCAAYDVIEILVKQREPLEDLRVICQGDQQAEPPYTFTRLHLHYVVKGGVKPERLARAIQLSEEKYCSVIATLRPGVPVSSDYEIVA